MRALYLLAAVLAGCATQQDLALMPPDELCYQSVSGMMLNSRSDFWQAISDRGIDCEKYQASVATRLESKDKAFANAQQTVQTMKANNQPQQQQNQNQLTCRQQGGGYYGKPYLVCN